MKVNNFTNELGDDIQGPVGIAAYATIAASLATPAIVLGTAAAAGVATTIIRSDATVAAFDTTVPGTSAVADAAATGSVAFAARRDHKHGREAFGTPVQVGIANAQGSALTVAASDHVHQARDGEHAHLMNLWYSGDAVTTAFELPAGAVDENSVRVWVSGTLTDVTLSGTLLTTMTFGAAPAAAANNIVVDLTAAVV